MSTWDNFRKNSEYPSLEKDLETDIAVIGGGMAGVLITYMLCRAGLKVVLLEKNVLGAGATLATTAFITKVIDTELSESASLFGPKVARAVWESGQTTIEELEKIIEEESISCEFTRCSNFIFANSPTQLSDLKKDFKYYKRYGIDASFEEEGSSLNFPNLGYIEIPRQAKFHPAKFLFALAEKAKKYGAQIFEHTNVKKIERKHVSIIKTNNGKVTAQNVVIATYKPLVSKSTHLKKAMYKSYVFEVQVPKGLFKEALYEDNGNPYSYFRIDAGDDYDRMIIGGEDHKDIFGKTLEKKSFIALGKYLDQILDSRRYWISHKWAGPILEPSDGLPLIGEIAPGQYVATGFSGNGMTYSMISALLIRDLIEGSKNPWQKVYDPKRTLLQPKRLASKAKDYVEEFWNGALKNMLS